MAFSEATKDLAFARSGGRCECRRTGHGHAARCHTRVMRRGAGTEYNHVHASRLGGSDGLSNCEVLCERCHVLTASYGRH